MSRWLEAQVHLDIIRGSLTLRCLHANVDLRAWGDLDNSDFTLSNNIIRFDWTDVGVMIALFATGAQTVSYRWYTAPTPTCLKGQ